MRFLTRFMMRSNAPRSERFSILKDRDFRRAARGISLSHSNLRARMFTPIFFSSYSMMICHQRIGTSSALVYTRSKSRGGWQRSDDTDAGDTERGNAEASYTFWPSADATTSTTRWGNSVMHLPWSQPLL